MIVLLDIDAVPTRYSKCIAGSAANWYFADSRSHMSRSSTPRIARSLLNTPTSSMHFRRTSTAATCVPHILSSS